MRVLSSPSLALLAACAACGGPQEGEDPETCYDDVDNDEDGALDCLDDGCGDAAGCPGDTGTGEAPQDRFCVNEFMASNASTSVGLDDETGDARFPDWIELYSYLSHPLSLEGYTITDDLDDPRKHVLGDLVLPTRGVLLLFADGTTGGDPAHLSFGLDVTGEEIGVYAPDGAPVDKLAYVEQATDWSAARIPDGSQAEDAWQIVGDPTPGTVNVVW